MATVNNYKINKHNKARQTHNYFSYKRHKNINLIKHNFMNRHEYLLQLNSRTESRKITQSKKINKCIDDIQQHILYVLTVSNV